MTRFRLEAAIAPLVDSSSLEAVVHALIEDCYRRSLFANARNQHEEADRWRAIARELTRSEDVASKLGL